MVNLVFIQVIYVLIDAIDAGIKKTDLTYSKPMYESSLLCMS